MKYVRETLMNTSRYIACAAAFGALLAASYLYSQPSAEPSTFYTALSALPDNPGEAAESLIDFCFNEQLIIVSCDYETMLGASGNASDIRHVTLQK
jgi:hypothetical protein